MKITIISNESIGENAFYKAFAQILETEFSDLRLVLCS